MTTIDQTHDVLELQRQLARITQSVDRLAGTKPVVTFGAFAREYLDAKLADPTLRKNTKASFQNQVRKHLIPAFYELSLGSVTNAEWRAWVALQREKKPSVRFFNARKALIEVLLAAKEAGHIEKLPKFDNPDEARNVGRAMEEHEILRIIWAANRPFRFIFYTFWKMGCRPREILQWEWSMIQWNGREKTWLSVPARISKTDRSRSIALNPGVVRILAIRARKKPTSKFVFPARGDDSRYQHSYQSAWLTACRHARVDATAYDLRRTFITRRAAKGQPLLYIAKHLDTSTGLIEKVYAKAQADVMESIAGD